MRAKKGLELIKHGAQGDREVETYPDPTLFLHRARAHMRQWMSNELLVEPTDQVSVLLPATDAASGKNFYDHDVRRAVQERFPRAFRESPSPGSRVGDALCSAQAPFNLFGPLCSDLHSDRAACVVSSMLGVAVDRVDGIAFEQPARRQDNPLGDNTAFDALISATADDQPVSVGIEVKFTEGPYGWGRTEKERMHDPGSCYNVATTSGGRFRPNAGVDLRNCHLKQVWRNMLLAQALGSKHAVPSYYVHLYPEGNHYQATVVGNFARTLTDHGSAFFRPITYEDYFQILIQAGCDGGWLAYLRKRYLVSAGRAGSR